MADSKSTVDNLFQTITNYINWENFASFANSSFSTSLMGAVAGAFAGTYAAQRIIERHKLREELLSEIRNTNAAISLAFTISNSALALKKQHLVELKKCYEKERALVLEHQRRHSIGKVAADAIHNFRADLMTLPNLFLPIDVLRTQVFERLSVIGRPLALATNIFQSALQTNEAIAKRNQLIDLYRSTSDNERFVELYFALPFESGHVNSEYRDSLTAICSNTDDVVFFTSELCTDLQLHGKELVERYKSSFRGKAPVVNEVNFDKAREIGLMPNPDDYRDWLTSFVKEV